MTTQEAFYEYGEKVVEPVIERARSSYYKAADFERTVAARVQAIESAERELQAALSALKHIKEAIEKEAA